MGRYPTGIDRVCLEYMRHYGPQAQAVVQHRRYRRILDRESSKVLFELLAHPPANFRSALITAFARIGLNRSCDGAERKYLNVGHTGLNDPGFSQWLRTSAVRPFYFVHDLIPITHPEYCRAGERRKHIERMRTVLATAHGVIGNSQATLRDLATFAQSEAVPMPRSVAAILGGDGLPGRQGTSRSEVPTFVILGTIEARKNHLMLLQVWSRIAMAMGGRTPHLLVIGQRGWECEQVLDLLERSQSLRGVVTEIGRCDDTTLMNYLGQASALLFPSLVEGYGLPIVEAMRAGTPVIASDLPVFREIAGDIPTYLDPLDGPAWERAIRDYAGHRSAARNEQLSRLASYRAPTWGDHFATVDSWLPTI